MSPVAFLRCGPRGSWVAERSVLCFRACLSGPCFHQPAEAGLQVNYLWEEQDHVNRGPILVQPMQPHRNQRRDLSPRDMCYKHSLPSPPSFLSRPFFFSLELHIKSSRSPSRVWGWCWGFSCTLLELVVAGAGHTRSPVILTGPGPEAQGICPVPSELLCRPLAADKTIAKDAKVFQEATVTPFPQEDHLLSFCYLVKPMVLSLFNHKLGC